MRTASSISAALAVVVLATGALAGPIDQIRQYGDQVVKVLEDPGLRGPDRRLERRAAVRRIAIEIFDLGETAKRALGRHWQARTEAEREEFVRLFAELLESAYLSKIDFYGGEKLRYVGESIDGDHAIVRGRVATKQGTEVPVDARMLRRGERWLIYDVTIENVSLIGNYRAQFDRIIRASSYEELVKRLQAKREE
ncbi:MAG: ABC transporter substrate-binding protein [Candidatus Rokubacteria bacterium]|nr:ABC transporter substrate-binding protein [Candidatus Rokubacteria bacterium]